MRLNGLDVDPSGPYVDETVEAVEQLAEDLIDEPGFARWPESRTVPLSGNLLAFVEESDAASYEIAGADPQGSTRLGGHAHGRRHARVLCGTPAG